MKKVLFVTSRVDDARELTYRALNVWSVTVPSDLAFAPALAATGNFDFALFDIGLVGAWAPDLLRDVIASRAGFPVFILSREYALSFQALARKSGAADYISIPYAFPSLKKRIDRVLDSPEDRALPVAGDAHDASVSGDAPDVDGVLASGASALALGGSRSSRDDRAKTCPAAEAANRDPNGSRGVHAPKRNPGQAPRSPCASPEVPLATFSEGNATVGDGNAEPVPVGHGARSVHAAAFTREDLPHYGQVGKPSPAGNPKDGSGHDAIRGRPCIVGHSDAMAALRAQIHSIRETTETVLITGETGSGKDLVARMIHEESPVSDGPFVPCNVSCIAESLAESMLFGTCRGSYTGSLRDVKGLFEEATCGTLFLDEIGEMSLSLQPKLLRVLEEGAVCRLGSYERRPVRFRLICATHRDLAGMVAARRFRSDLFYRLDIIRVESPPLRSHPEDIPALASRCLLRHRKVLSPRALEKLKGYAWPGNVRQLFNCLARAACVADGAVIDCDHINF